MQKAAVQLCPVTSLKDINKELLSTVFIHIGSTNDMVTTDNILLPKDLEFVVKQKDYNQITNLGLPRIDVKGLYLHINNLIFLN